jgi:hypothetical protein
MIPMNIRIIPIVFSFVSLSLVHSAMASRIEVVNENKKALKVKIKAEGSNVQEDLTTYVKEIPAENHYIFLIEGPDLKGKSHYSIKGDTNPFTPGGRCDYLSVEKDYKVTFLNEAMGTTCVAEEIK